MRATEEKIEAFRVEMSLSDVERAVTDAAERELRNCKPYAAGRDFHEPILAKDNYGGYKVTFVPKPKRDPAEELIAMADNATSV